MPIEKDKTASDIASQPADVETLDTYEKKIQYYDERDFTYIPIPASGEYYDISEGWKRNIRPAQHIKHDEPLDEVFDRLTEERFLLVSSQGANKAVIREGNFIGYFAENEEEHRWLKYAPDDGSESGPPAPESLDEDTVQSVHVLESRYPDIAESIHSEPYDERYGIITLADLNKRKTKDALYPLVAEVAYLLALKIEDRYPNSEELLKYINADTVGRWYQSKKQGIHMHVSEQMNLAEMQSVVKASDSDFVKQCGFPSKNQVGKQLGSINRLRNKVMHANRTLVRSRDDLRKMVERVEKLEKVVSNLRETVDHDLTN